MINILRIFSVLSIIFLIAVPAYAAEAIVSSGDTQLSKSFGKFHIQVRLRTHEISIGQPGDKRPEKSETSCTYSRYPCSLIDNLTVSIDGNMLFVPRSSYCSLSDLNFIDIEHKRGLFILTLIGGDASESFIAKIQFSKTRVISKTLSSALNPKDVLEETLYKKQKEIFDQ